MDCNKLKFDVEESSKYVNVNEYAPKWPFRMVILGPSGCGKSQLVGNLLLNRYLFFDKLFLFVKNMQEPVNSTLINVFSQIPDALEVQLTPMDSNQQNLFVFDDYISESNQKFIKDLFILGRKHNASCIYLAQSFYDIPKIIRNQCNFYIFFDVRNQREKTEISKDFGTEFLHHYRDAIKEPYDFLCLDTRNPHMKYRRRFDQVL